MPEPKDGNAILRINRIGICGTDIHAFEGTQPYFSYPRVLGHELSAEVVSVSVNSGFIAGDVVTVIPYKNCGTCIACRNGKENCCVQMQVYGVHADGGMAEFFQVPERLLVHGQGLNHDELALVEPLAIGAHAVRRAGLVPREFVLVNGAGPIGLAVMTYAKIAGCKVIAADVNPYRLEFCRDKVGTEYLVNPADGDMETKLQHITSGDMPTVIFDATGNKQAIESSFSYMAHGGRYVLVGLQKGNIEVNHPEFHKREGTLLSSRNATRQDFEQVISSIQQKLIDPTVFITHRADFYDTDDNLQLYLTKEKNLIKTLLCL
ncbi:zinc-binding alcohol dehydrogenase family protein [Mucilaginibacter terrenus]|nr:zinc-binding alcohol dehydrogenase family protein [Mucilaginibacter terrenus]